MFQHLLHLLSRRFRRLRPRRSSYNYNRRATRRKKKRGLLKFSSARFFFGGARVWECAEVYLSTTGYWRCWSALRSLWVCFRCMFALALRHCAQVPPLAPSCWLLVATATATAKEILKYYSSRTSSPLLTGFF